MASTTLTISGNTATPVNFPGLAFNANETGTPVYFEDREDQGILYRARNATFNGTVWSLVTVSGVHTYALAQYPNGQLVYLEPPTGMTSWSTSAWVVKGRDGVFNVRDFGAVADGTTDDQPFIQAANDAAVLAGGGYVYLPTGTYLIKNLIALGSLSPTPQNIPITLGGDGAAFTILQANNGINGALGVSIMVANAQWNSATTSVVQQNIFVEKLGFNGNGENNNTSSGLIFLKQVYNCGVSDCEVFNSSTNGILITGTGPVAFPGLNINFKILRNHINLNYDPHGTPTVAGTFPIRAEGASIGLIEGNVIGELNTMYTNDAIDCPGSSDVTVNNNYVYMCTDGIGTNDSRNPIITNNHISTTLGYGISTFSSGKFDAADDGSSRVVIANNIISNCGKTGIRVSSPPFNGLPPPVDFAVTGNIVVLGSAGGPNGIHIEMNNGSVTGNTIDLGATNNAGLTLDSGPNINLKNVTCANNAVLNAGFSGGSTGIVFSIAGSSTFTDCNVTGNIVDSTITTPIALPALNRLSNCTIRDNTRINPYAGAVTVFPVPPPPGGTVSNILPFDVDVYVVGNGASSISVNGQITGLTGGAFFVEAGGTIAWAGVAPKPTWVWIPR